MPETEVRRVPFMFLGGDLDHTTRLIEVAGSSLTPVPEIIKHKPSTLQTWGREPVNFPDRNYYRYRVETGRGTWWAYVMEGYEPSTRDLLDANYNPFT